MFLRELVLPYEDFQKPMSVKSTSRNFSRQIYEIVKTLTSTEPEDRVELIYLLVTPMILQTAVSLISKLDRRLLKDMKSQFERLLTYAYNHQFSQADMYLFNRDNDFEINTWITQF
jgi:hypothetical protein